MNFEKIYLDVFFEEFMFGGECYLLVIEQFNWFVFKGVFVVIYLGYGGFKGWVQEWVFNILDIFGWDNKNNMFIFIIVICIFIGFDDFFFVFVGEEVLFNLWGGVLVLMIIVCFVFIGGNKCLMANVMEYILLKLEEGLFYMVGEVYLFGKN